MGIVRELNDAGADRGLAASEHIDARRLAAFIDDGLRGQERELVVSHLANCGLCRKEFVDLRRALGQEGRANDRRRVARTAIPIAVAAVLVLGVFPAVMNRSRADRQGQVTRDAAEPRLVDAVPAIAIASPADNASLAPRPALIWRAAGPNTMYLLTVQDSTGNVLWTTTTADTAVTLPSSVPLRTGARYFWSVDARLGDGRSTRTGAHAFSIR